MRRPLPWLLLAMALGNAALVWSMAAHGWALRLVYHDTTGAAYEAPPDSAMRARIGDLEFDYGMGMDRLRAQRLGLPRATRAGAGFADVEANVRWIRSRFRTGGFYGHRPWRIEEAIEAARDPHRRFYCFSYAAAMVTLCESQGYAARLVSLDGHLTSSVYLPALRKWVLVDALHDVIPFDAAGRPLSAVESHRLLRQGGTIEWRRVHGAPDDSSSTFDRAGIESLLRRGDFLINDGPSTFDLRGRLGRAIDVLQGRPRTLQLAMDGQPPLDATTRKLRAGLLGWNLLGAIAIVGASHRRSKAESSAASAPAA